MTKQVLLLLHADAEIFAAKQILLRADADLAIWAFQNSARLVEINAEAARSIIFCLTDRTDVQDGLRRNKIDCPTLLVNADIAAEDLQKAYESGIAGYLPGPLNSESNLRRLQNYFDLLQIQLQVWPYCNIPSLGEATAEEVTPLIWWELH